jgi:hypothetical protein
LVLHGRCDDLLEEGFQPEWHPLPSKRVQLNDADIRTILPSKLRARKKVNLRKSEQNKSLGHNQGSPDLSQEASVFKKT